MLNFKNNIIPTRLILDSFVEQSGVASLGPIQTHVTAREYRASSLVSGVRSNIPIVRKTGRHRRRAVKGVLDSGTEETCVIHSSFILNTDSLTLAAQFGPMIQETNSPSFRTTKALVCGRHSFTSFLKLPHQESKNFHINNLKILLVAEWLIIKGRTVSRGSPLKVVFNAQPKGSSLAATTKGQHFVCHVT